MRTPTEQRFLNKLTFYVCAISFEIVLAAYVLLPINWDILIIK